MHIIIMALGTRGDVQPYVALGKGLKKAGHTVRLATHQNFEGLVRSHGLDFWSMRGNVQEIAESPEMRALLEKGNFIAITAKTAREAQRAALQWAEDGLAACEGMELIIAGIGGLFIGLALAEKLGMQLLQAHLLPFTPTRAFPSVLLPTSVSRLGGAFNAISHHLTRQIMWQGSRSADKVSRQQVLGLPAAPFFGPYRSDRLNALPVLYGFSPSVIPEPSDWDQHIHVTGFWFLESESDWQPSPALLEFLQSGPPPVYVGFGSMTNRNPQATADLVLKALARTQQRAIMLSGWDGLGTAHIPDTVFMVESIPHAWLFPQVAAAVHHGGVGTTAAGLRAGVPSIITPFFGDQPFWGARIAALGVGVEPIPRKQLTAERLAEAIQTAVTDQAMRQRAAELGARIRAEDGVARAVDIVQSIKR